MSSCSTQVLICSLESNKLHFCSDRDTNIITYNWVRGKKVPMANFNVQRTCPDWGVMDRWAAQRQVPELPTKPPNAVQLPYIP